MSFLNNILSFKDSSKTSEESAKINKGAIGSFGNIIFSVSSSKVYTFDDFKRSTKSRWATHEILGKKPISEYLGEDLDNISLKIQLHAELGVDPLAEYEKIINACRDGRVEFLVIGTHIHGRYKWYIEDVSLVVKHFDGNGNVIFCECDVKFKEYASD